MNLISVYTKRPGRGWILYCNTPREGRKLTDILRTEAAAIEWVHRPILTPQHPEDMVNEYGSRKNPMVDQGHSMYCCIPHRPVEWWRKKAKEIDGEFSHEDGLPVIRRVATLFTDDLLKAEEGEP